MLEPVGTHMHDTDRGELLDQLESLLKIPEQTLLHRLCALSNASAFLGAVFNRVNWVGFYLVAPDGTLVLGPFQGRPACTVIPYGKGVCGTAWKHMETMVVPDVHAFAGHIACDESSRSEVVVPIVVSGAVVAVLDVDSPYLDRFSVDDVRFLEKAAHMVSHILPLT